MPEKNDGTGGFLVTSKEDPVQPSRKPLRPLSLIEEKANPATWTCERSEEGRLDLHLARVNRQHALLIDPNTFPHH